VIYLSAQAHHSIDKAIRIAGLADCVIRRLPLDPKYRIIVRALREQIKSDKAAGLDPFLVVASAGTTDVGAVDPLVQIADIAAEFGLWYHIDAAYGGFFRLTEEGREKMAGIELSDSIVIDPHKGLFVPYGLGVVLVKDRAKMQAAQYHTASYMQDALASEEEPSPADLSPELTRPFRGLRLWLPLKLHGIAPFRACLEEKLLLAKYFYEEVQKLGFVCDLEPELSVVVYRYEPETGDADEYNKRLLAEVIEDGRIFISSTMLDGKFTLRFACLAFRTHLKTVDTLLSVLKEKVHLLGSK
jgi:glutamate/tyrosine decarboxylase-like PLP-dependent enzyme